MGVVILYLYTKDYDVTRLPQYTPGKAGVQIAPGVFIHCDGRRRDSVLERQTRDVLVYRCADMLGIEELKDLAARRFLETSSEEFPPPGL